MRIVALVFATLFLLGSTVLGGFAARRYFADAKEISSASKDLKALGDLGDDPSLKHISDMDKQTGSIRTGGFIMILAAGLSLATLVMAYAGKGAPIGAALVAAATFLAIIVVPAYRDGARAVTVMEAILACLGAASAWGATALRRRAAAPSTNVQPTALAA